MPIKVRRAEIGDAPSIAFVQVEAWRCTYSNIVPDAFLASMDTATRTNSWKTQLIDNNTSLFVAEDDSGIFGFACGGRVREEVGDYDAELYAIYLLQHKQRQGTGRTMIEKLVNDFRAAGLKSLMVWVLEQNPSIGFYEHLGGIPVARKSVQIGGTDFQEVAFGWPILNSLVPGSG